MSYISSLPSAGSGVRMAGAGITVGAVSVTWLCTIYLFALISFVSIILFVIVVHSGARAYARRHPSR